MGSTARVAPCQITKPLIDKQSTVNKLFLTLSSGCARYKMRETTVRGFSQVSQRDERAKHNASKYDFVKVRSMHANDAFCRKGEMQPGNVMIL